ncbi:MAG: hypothetical protein RKE49_08315 [Oceanicaulis sp.]
MTLDTRSDQNAQVGEDAGVVRFLCSPDMEESLPKPQPAGRFTPDWMRNLPREMGMPGADGLPALTVKACMPVTDAFAAGWIFSLAKTVFIEADTHGQVLYQDDPTAGFEQITRHHPGQIGGPNPPFGHAHPLKWTLPWRVAAPQGVSLMFTQPLNHFELPFQNFTGIVDADRFAARVNAPFLWRGGAGRFALPAGMPIVQVVPIGRAALGLKADMRAATAQETEEEAEHTRLKYSVESVYSRQFRARRRI